MIQTCKQCGAVNEAHAETCCFCDTQFAPHPAAPGAPRRAASIEGNLAVAVDWRREVAQRLQIYRARRRRLHPNESQTALPFSAAGTGSEEENSAAFGLARDSESPFGESKSFSRMERVEINVMQPDLDLPAAEERLYGGRAITGATSSTCLLPVAALNERRRAGLFDALFLLLAFAGFLALFRSLGGQFSFGKSEAAVYVATLVLFYAQYFGLFTFFGGATPGMLVSRLHVVNFDGSAPTPRQLLWRSFGYLVSGGTVFLGFLWALWDEDRLTWHDRISQTYLTAAERAGEHAPIRVTQHTQGLS